ncbi:hypothetical protein F5148DRAFT_1283443 [Russula earlei]|uniref:Uncharacterized protein n=1 Tax=Russula earlei TaxID=71964 RepID=A0ACC0UCJ1_9AGAM|nr:hypothetical protein F5148DRAFT_1283443 [Russula earlei]
MGNTLTWVLKNDHGSGPNPSINILPDDVLLEVFDFYRLDIIYAWNHRCWYKLAHTCRRWRNIIFSSSSRLDLRLVCSYGTPVVDMLSHSPPLPIHVNYGGPWSFSTMDEEGAFLALQKHDRVRSIDLYASTTTLEKLFAAMDGPFPALEELSLAVEIPDADEDESEDDEPECPRLPQTFRAPSIPVSLYLPNEYLASCLSLMPRLEYFGLNFDYYDPDEVLVYAPNIERISLPNLKRIFFKGDSCYLECLAARIDAPLLWDFNAQFLKEPSSPLQYLSGLLSAAGELKLPVASITFSGMRVDDPKMAFHCQPLNVQVASTVQICAALTPMFSAVERLHLDFEGGRWLFDSEVDIERSQWHDLLRPFRNVVKLQVDTGLMEDLSLALCPDDDGPSGEEILPELCKLVRPGYGCFRDAFDEFIVARREAGQHIIKRRRPPIPCSESGEDEEEDDEGDDEEDDEDEDDDDDEEVEGVEVEEHGEVGDSDTSVGSDPDSGTNDEFGFSTELDSDSDSD